MIPKVDTFEHDIVDEIKRKDASLTEISAASNNVGNTDPVILPKQRPVLLYTLIGLFIVFVLGLGVVGYMYFTDTLLPHNAVEQPIQQNIIPKTTVDISSISPALSSSVGRFVTRVEKKDTGYILTITDYSAVFAYMTRNEKEYMNDLLNLFSQAPTPDVSETLLGNDSTSSYQMLPIITEEPPKIATSSPAPTVATTSRATSTKKVIKGKQSTTGTSTSVHIATSTIATTTAMSTTTIATSTKKEVEEVSLTPRFSDVTLSNQNIRVLSIGRRTVAYAFLNTTTLLIANTPEQILLLRGDILH